MSTKRTARKIVSAERPRSIVQAQDALEAFCTEHPEFEVELSSVLSALRSAADDLDGYWLHDRRTIQTLRDRLKRLRERSTEKRANDAARTEAKIVEQWKCSTLPERNRATVIGKNVDCTAKHVLFVATKNGLRKKQT